VAKFIVLSLCCVLLVGCGDSAVKKAVRESLVDPDSAKFGSVKYSKNGEAACVTVNAKNRMGGYTGDSQIIVEKIDGKWSAINDEDTSQDTCMQVIDELTNNRS